MICMTTCRRIRSLISTGLMLVLLAGCAGITPRPDLIKSQEPQSPQSVYEGGG